MSVNVQYVGFTATGTRIDKIEKLYHTRVKQWAQLQNTARSNKRLYLLARNQLVRTRVAVSLLVRSIHFNEHEKNSVGRSVSDATRRRS